MEKIKLLLKGAQRMERQTSDENLK